ncbi:hypothetical protein BT93_L2412 [Corymbia citriodora subsp. variegata]|uniref:Uncharacterized protein n=1 Tax=Corymbia citriodora subsp. variegata TaxID=360336 RepID=A0A8T0CK46_CORYI|nr:hypothetical protein BT93_L2412 [Corymbia citriodora subsp. variegata]
MVRGKSSRRFSPTGSGRIRRRGRRRSGYTGIEDRGQKWILVCFWDLRAKEVIEVIIALALRQSNVLRNWVSRSFPRAGAGASLESKIPTRFSRLWWSSRPACEVFAGLSVKVFAGLSVSRSFPRAEAGSDVDGPLRRHQISQEDHPLSLGKARVWNQYFEVHISFPSCGVRSVLPCPILELMFTAIETCVSRIQKLQSR